MLGDYPNGPPPQYPVGGPPQRSNRAIGITVATLGAITLVLTIVVVAVLIGRSLPFDSAADAEETSPTPSDPEPEESPEASPVEEEQEEEQSDEDAQTTPTIDGWQGVAAQRRPLEYDVPDDWIVESPGMMYGFEEEDPDAPFGYSPTVTMSGVSFWPSTQDGCSEDGPGSGQVGTSGMGEMVDTAQGAESVAMEWAQAAYEHDDGDPQLSAAEVEPFEENGLSGHLATVEVTPTPADCYPEAAEVRVASVEFPEQDDVYNIIIYADTTSPVAPDAEGLDTILTTVRPQDDWVDPDS